MRFITIFFIFIVVLAVIDTVRRIKIAQIKRDRKKINKKAPTKSKS